MKKYYSIAAILMILCSASITAQNVSISGNISDENKRPMFGVNIFIPGTTIGTTSDFDGNFSLSVPSSTETVSVKFIGYEEIKLAVDKSKATQTVNLQMKQLEIGLEQIVVSASKRKERILDAPASVTVLGADKIEKNVAVTAIDNLKSVPGVDIMQTGLVSANVNVRGFNNIFSGAMLTIVDNRIGRVPSLRVNAFQLIPTSNSDIEKIELVRGPGSALYGPNAADGVLHIMTKSPLNQEKKFETTISLSAGVRSNSEIDTSGPLNLPLDENTDFIDRGIISPEFRHSGKISEKFGYKISGSYMEGNDWKYFDPREPDEGDTIIFGSVINGQLFQADTTRAPETFHRNFDVTKWNLDARLDFALTQDMDLTFNGGIARSTNLELTGLGGAQGVGWTYIYGQMRFRWKNLFFQYFLNSSNANDTYLIPQVGEGTEGPHNIQLLTDKSKLHGLQLQHNSEPVENLNLIYGLDALMTRPNTEGTINGRFEEDDAINQIGGYVQAEYDVTEKITLVGAARADFQTPIDEWNISPRAAFVYKPTPRHTTRLTYNRAFGTPSSLNLFLDISNGAHPVHGFNFRGIGNPEGYQYQRGDNGIPQYINLWTYDPSNPSNTQYADIADLSNNSFYWDRLMDVLVVLFVQQSGLNEGIIQGVVNAIFSDVGGPGGTINDVGLVGVDFIELLSTADVGKSLWNGNGDISNINDLTAIESSITQTMELGYKGIIADKLFVTADAYYTKISNFVSPLTLASPTISFNPTELDAALAPIEAIMGDPNTPGTIAALIGLSFEEMKASIQSLNANVPSGVVTPQGDKVNSDVILTYINLGDVDVAGLDIGFSYYATENISISGAGSFVNKDRIPLDGASEGFVGLNAPRFKASLGFEHNLKKTGFGYGVNWRWQDAFPANSAVYIGDVLAANFVDARVTYRPNWSKNTVFTVDVTNILNNKHQRFPGTPKISRLTLARVAHTF